jgi:hypothetical protein
VQTGARAAGKYKDSGGIEEVRVDEAAEFAGKVSVEILGEGVEGGRW